MLRVVFQSDKTEAEAAALVQRPWLKFPDIAFKRLTREYDINKDDDFKRFLFEVDRCDLPMPNVVRDIPTGSTHSIDRVSTGVKMLWLMARHAEDYLFPSQYLGENCYLSMFELSKTRDIYLYEDSDMFVSKEADVVGYVIHDEVSDKDIELGCERGIDYTIEWK